MKEMTLKDFNNLKHGDRVTKIFKERERELRYVGKMPNSENYYIFSDGEHLEFFHHSSPLAYWHIGDYDKKYVGEILISYYKRKLEDVKHIYFNTNKPF